MDGVPGLYRTKRKRTEDSEEERIEARITRKLHHHLKVVRKAAKKAKTFEIQKLVKHLKEHRLKINYGKEIEQLEAQLKTLKRTDHERVANTALKSKLNKDRILSENSHIQAAVSSELKSDLLFDVAGATQQPNVQSRLLSSKILSNEITQVIGDLRSLLQPDGSTSIPGEENSNGGARDHHQKYLSKPRKVTLNGGGDLEVRDTSLADQCRDDESIHNDVGWESGDIDDDGSDIDSQEANDSDAEEHVPPDTSFRLTNPQMAVTSTRSTFLPSLSVGFTRGDSDGSMLSDSETRLMDSPFKKNRRGQRARRAIWEKKYGRNANHKKKEIGAHERRHDYPVANRPQNRPAPHKTPSSDREAKRNPTRQHPDRADPDRAQLTRTLPIKADDQSRTTQEKPLHPSWEAKKKLKEKQSVGILPAQGTKIKFQ